jgi:hypothetical protein
MHAILMAFIDLLGRRSLLRAHYESVLITIYAEQHQLRKA